MKNQVARFMLITFVVFIGATAYAFAQKKDRERGVHVTIYGPSREKPRREGPDGGGSYGDGSSNGSLTKEANEALRAIDGFNREYGTPGAFTEAVLASNGEVPFSIREKFPVPPKYSYYLFHVLPDTSSGHHYLSLTRLGRSSKTPAQIMAVIMQDPDKVSPWFAAKGVNGQHVTLNNIYHLVNAVGNNPVKVTRVTPYFFTLTALPGHMLQGSATHGVFRDKTGELYLYQEGIGVPGESSAKGYLNNWIASFMWRDMGNVVRRHVVEP